MKHAIRSTGELRRRLNLQPLADERAAVAAAEDTFPTFVPLEFLSRIRPGDPHDPILKQVLSVADEVASAGGFVSDPVGDLGAVAAPGLLHKYDRRALVITTGACGVHCRYCFRREFPYSESGSQRQSWQPAIDYLRAHVEIDEVLLSGGDPLTLVDDRLFELISAIESIPHVRRLRLHTRMPVVIPQRVTGELVDRLVASRLAVWVVIHCNHAQELDSTVFAATDAMIDRGLPLLNQAVLLRGVNDSADALEQLCRELVDHRIQPYYLHQLDRVRGAEHFEVSVSVGRALVEQLRDRLPGYAVPNYVVEQAGERCKTPLHS